MGLGVDVVVHRENFELRAALEIREGETLALLGPNGSGKSTLAACIAGLIKPEEGTIELEGRVLDDVAAGIRVPAEKRRIGMMFQTGLLFPNMTALQNIAFPDEARGAGRGQAESSAALRLDSMGASDLARRKAESLSGGEAQIVALARALAGGPEVVLLDEPLSALDVRTKPRVRDVLADALARLDRPALLVTHDPVDATVLADRIAIMEDGRVTQIGTATEIRETPLTAYAADVAGVNVFRGILGQLDEGDALLRTQHGDLVVAPDAESFDISSGAEVLAVLKPADVSLHAFVPEGSARNVIQGTVASVITEHGRARVRIDGSPPVTAEITLGSLERMGLHRGDEVFAAFKAVEIKLLPAGAASLEFDEHRHP